MKHIWFTATLLLGLTYPAVAQTPNSLGYVIDNLPPASLPFSGASENMVVTQGALAHRVTPGELFAGTSHVTTNAALALVPIATFPNGVQRDDYSAGLGAPPLYFKPQTGTCVANSMVNDGGSCTNSPASDGNSWKAAFPPGGADMREWGVAFDNSTDNSVPMLASFVWAGTGMGCLIVPSTTSAARFHDTMFVTIAENKTLCVRGEAINTSILRYTQLGVGIQVTYGGADSSATLTDFSLQTINASDTSVGLELIQTGLVKTRGPQSTISIYLSGEDGPNWVHYWGFGVHVVSVSNVNYPGLRVQGPTVGSVCVIGANDCKGVGAFVVGANGLEALVHNFTSITMWDLHTGIQHGTYTQGVTVSGGSNFIADYCVYIPDVAGTDQITFIGNHCAPQTGAGIYGSVNHLSAVGNYFLPGGTSRGIRLTNSTSGYTITGNVFSADTANTATHIQIDDETATGNAGAITGNRFVNGLAGINFTKASGASYTVIEGNSYAGQVNGRTGTGGMTYVAGDSSESITLTTACSSSLYGRQATQSDAGTLTWGSTATHTASNVAARIFCNGTNWTVMGK